MRRIRNIAALFCIVPCLMGAAVYRWVDENGVVNYTQLKPEGVDAELVSADTGQRLATSPRPATEAAVDGNDAQQLSEQQRQMLADLKAAEQARQDQLAQMRQANCQQARELLQRLTSRGRVRVVGNDGVERVMPEEERVRRIDEAQRGVAENCAATASR